MKVGSLAQAFIQSLTLQMQKIDPQSEDGKSLTNWKSGYRHSAGDFPERCYEILKKREGHRASSNLTIDQVNDLLNSLSEHPDK